MDLKKLKKLKAELKAIRLSPQGRKEHELVAIAKKVGRTRDKRGSEPNYVREDNPALSPPLSIPGHGAKDLKPGTVRSIVDALLSDLDAWEIFLMDAEEDE